MARIGPIRVPETSMRPSRMLADVQTRRIAIAQIAPRLGSLDVNLATHHDLLGKARDARADLVVFPELGLTGY